MIKPFIRHCSLSLLTVALVLASGAAPAQESVTLPRKEYEELKRQAVAAERLKGELERVQAELARLKQVTSSTQPKPASVPSSKPETAAPARPAPTANPPATITARPAASPASAEPLPALRADEFADVTEVIRDYAQRAVPAAARYEKASVRLQGVIAAFTKPSLRRDYEIVFRTAEGQLVCRVAPPAEYTAVFTTQSGAVLTGRTERGGEKELLRTGDVVTLEATGQGLKDGSVLFSRGKVLGRR